MRYGYLSDLRLGEKDRIDIFGYITYHNVTNIYHKDLKEKSDFMRKYWKMICIAGMLGMLLTGCGKQEEDPLQAVYASIQEMSFETALQQLDGIEADRSNRQELYRLTGICYMGMGRYEEAKTAFETALEYNDGFVQDIDYDINQYLAVVYYNLGEFENAEHVYSAMIALQPENAEVYVSYGITLLQLDRYEQSKAAFDQAVALAPSDYDQIIEIYKAFYGFGYGELALEYIEAALGAQTEMDNYDKGRILYHVGRYSEAVSALEKVDMESHADTALYLGMTYEAMGDYNYAANVYNNGITKSTDPALYNHLGLCQMKRGAYEEALQAFQEGLACEDTSLKQSLRFNEAVAYEYVGDFQTAKALMQAYLKDYPNDTKAQREYEFLQTR